MNTPRPFHLHVPDSELERIRRRVAEYPWDDMPDDDGWQLGTSKAYLRELCNYWVDGYDWREHEARINAFDHRIVAIDGLDLHYLHEAGSGPSPTPLLISHGWPGSVVEFLDIIEPLAHPERFGGRIEDAFEVVAPSLPGFAFSAAPSHPWGPRRMARTLNTLMKEVLGHQHYLAQGGDWGGAIASWLGFEHAPACAGIHINILTMRHPDGPIGAEERAWADAFDRDQLPQDGYRTQQATRPQTLGYAMADSPVGIAAWLIEKFHGWSDLDGDDLESAHDRDALLTNIMVYVVTRCFTSAAWIYAGRREEGGRILSPEGRRVEVPTGCALFPAEMLAWPPRSYVDRLYNVTHWTSMPAGGHFAALEQPDLLVDDIRAFARSMR